LKLGQLSCKSLEDAICLGLDLVNFNFGFYDARLGFDNKEIVHCLFNPKEKFLPSCHIEDFWEDCVDELDVKRRELSRFSLSQIKLYLPNVDITDLEEDDEGTLGNQTKDPSILGQIVLDWNEMEQDDVNKRT
jgi:hypothetical protein